MGSKRKKKGNSRFFTVLGATGFALVWLGIIFVLFPVGNPLKTFGGTSAEGVIYAIIFGIVISFVILVLYSLRTAFKDIVLSVAADLGLDLKELGQDYKSLLADDVMAMMGRKKPGHDHPDE